MRISVTHSTIYRYDRPVQLEPHVFRLRPRADASQRLVEYDLAITPAPSGRTECLDQDGNATVYAWFDAPVHEMAVRSAFQIETLRDNPFDFLLAGPGMLALPLAFTEPLGAALAPYLIESGSAAVGGFATSVAAACGYRTLDFLTALNRRLSEDFQHMVREAGLPDPPEVTLSRRAGSCRDLAMLFCAASRTVGIPSRFVSGYECGAASQDKAYMHAWAEVYLDGGGWRGYDPSAGLAVSTSHVAVAAAADPLLAAPVSGSFRGDARSAIEFAISLQAAHDAMFRRGVSG